MIEYNTNHDIMSLKEKQVAAKQDVKLDSTNS